MDYLYLTLAYQSIWKFLLSSFLDITSWYHSFPLKLYSTANYLILTCNALFVSHTILLKKVYLYLNYINTDINVNVLTKNI